MPGVGFRNRQRPRNVDVVKKRGRGSKLDDGLPAGLQYRPQVAQRGLDILLFGENAFRQFSNR